jgi:hypothetical protein
MARRGLLTAPIVFILAALAVSPTSVALAQGRGSQGAAAPPTPRLQAPIDLTGYWVAIISEDWRWRMITPSRGDFPSIPINLAAQKVAEAWDPAKDEAAGGQCKAYGAPGLMRGPTRLHITWLDDDTLKLGTDYGIQTRLFEFRNAPTGPPSLQGRSLAQWMLAGGGRGRGGPRFGAMKSVTTNLRPGYLRKNGVPYSEKTVFTEYWDLHTESNGDKYIVVTNTVDDPTYLQLPWITALHFKKESDGGKWNPEPCDARF